MISTGVAKTIGGDLVLNPAQISLEVIVAALIGSIVWNVATWYYRIPSSSSHSLVGGVIGAVSVSVGPSALDAGGIGRIVLSLICSPVIALATGYFVMIGLLWIFRNYSPIILNRRFRKMQLVSASLMAFSHGSNDAQKAMGIIALALLSGGYIDTMEIPIWVKIACATSMALGTSAGGWRIISTMGSKIFKMESINGFAADLNSSIVILRLRSFICPSVRLMSYLAPLWASGRQNECVPFIGASLAACFWPGLSRFLLALLFLALFI